MPQHYGANEVLSRAPPPVACLQARALLSGEWVELPVLPGGEGDPAETAAGGPGDGPVEVPCDGANEGMLLHRVHAR